MKLAHILYGILSWQDFVKLVMRGSDRSYREEHYIVISLAMYAEKCQVNRCFWRRTQFHCLLDCSGIGNGHPSVQNGWFGYRGAIKTLYCQDCPCQQDYLPIPIL